MTTPDTNDCGSIQAPVPPMANDCPLDLGAVSPDWFKEWFDSPYYHQLYAERDKKEAAALIEKLLALLQPPPGSAMLDVACGRGRHAYILAAHGYDVTGIDLSPATIAFARQFERENLHFYIHDMRRLLCTNCFDYAFNFFTSFGYFQTKREHSNAIRMVSLALKSKGVFVLDYLNSSYAEQNLVPSSQKIIDGVTYTMTRCSDATHFYKRIKIEDERTATPLEYIEKVAKFSLDDFREMFSMQGLHLQQAYGDYALTPYDPRQSPRLLMVAGKAPA